MKGEEVKKEIIKNENKEVIKNENNNNNEMEISQNDDDVIDAETQEELSQPIVQQQINNIEGIDVNFLHDYNMNEKNKKLYIFILYLRIYRCCEAVITIHNNNIKNITMLQLSKLLGGNYNVYNHIIINYS